MMKWIFIPLVLLFAGCSVIIPLMLKAESLTFGFNNPSFSGVGWSTHALSIAQLEFNRKKEVEDDAANAAASVKMTAQEMAMVVINF